MDVVLMRRVLEAICKHAKIDAKGWSEPRLVAESKSYRIDWTKEESSLTLYEDGHWSLEGQEVEEQEGRITPIHHSAWVERLRKDGVHGGIALGAVQYFKNLRK